jgi:hypothetical protein
MGAKGPVVFRQLQTGPARPAEQVIFLHRLLTIGASWHLHPNLIKIVAIFNISFYFFNFKVGVGKRQAEESAIDRAPSFTSRPSFPPEWKGPPLAAL